jgi:hypothetical protein
MISESSSKTKQQKQYFQSMTLAWIKTIQETVYFHYLDVQRLEILTKLFSLFNLPKEDDLIRQVKEKLSSFNLINIIMTEKNINQGKPLSEWLIRDILTYQKESFEFQHPCFEVENIKEFKVNRERKATFINDFLPIYREAKLQKSEKGSLKDYFIKLNQKAYKLILELYNQNFHSAIESFYHLTKLNHKVGSIRYLIEIFGTDIEQFKSVLSKEGK